jgi:exodeoxyribonuclease (lambda-induced)
MKIHRDIEQGSADWQTLRAGKITASELDRIISPLGKVRDSEGVMTFLHEKLCERWTGGPLLDAYGGTGVIFDCEQGIFLEERAKPAFVLHSGFDIENVAFVETEDGRCGCSPDGILRGLKAGVEIKAPRMDTHAGYLLAGKLPKAYVAQVQGSMFVTGFAVWHFFSYNRTLPPLHLVIERDDAFQSALREAVDGFLYKLDACYERLCALNGGPPRRPAIPIRQPAENFDVIP